MRILCLKMVASGCAILRLATYMQARAGSVSQKQTLSKWERLGLSLVPRPRPEKSEEGLVTLAPFPVSAESAILILGRPITFVHFQLPCQLLNSVRCGMRKRVKTDVVCSHSLEVMVGEANAAIEGAV